jgi:cell division protein FtsA
VARKERYLVGLDVGTSKVTAVVSELVDGGRLDVVGLGTADSQGIRRGVVVNVEAAVESPESRSTRCTWPCQARRSRGSTAGA